MPKKLLFAICLLFLPVVCAQTRINPDCVIPFTFITTGSTSNLTCGHNLQGIVNWTVAYSSTGFSGISLVVQSAPDNAGVPGAWATFAGTVLAGINPNTALTSNFTTFQGYYPWMRVDLASITGSGKVTGTLYGFLDSSAAVSSGSGGGGTTAFCDPTKTSTVAVTLTASGLTQILAASASKKITVCHLSLGPASAVNIQLEYGTKVTTDCDTGATAVSGVYQANGGLALDVPFTLPASQALCINQGTAVNNGGLLVYVQQ